MKKVQNQNKFNFQVNDEDYLKSSFSKNNPKTCVMVAIKKEGVAIQDSKDVSRKTLFFTPEEWEAFIKGVKAGEFS